MSNKKFVSFQDLSVHLGVCADRSVLYKQTLERRIVNEKPVLMEALKHLAMEGAKQGFIVVVSNPSRLWIAEGFKKLMLELMPALEELTRYQRETEAKIDAEKASVKD
jgi:hypothetical protein